MRKAALAIAGKRKLGGSSNSNSNSSNGDDSTAASDNSGNGSNNHHNQHAHHHNHHLQQQQQQQQQYGNSSRGGGGVEQPQIMSGVKVLGGLIGGGNNGNSSSSNGSMGNGSNHSSSRPISSSSRHYHHHHKQQQHPPPPEDVVALTAKNYRLAKELSEIRVRHREECKNVTRLTMENMNLASRCRDAIGQVAMLKKELAAHQRRSAEALALQRKAMMKEYSTGSNSGSISATSSSNMGTPDTATSSTDNVDDDVTPEKKTSLSTTAYLNSTSSSSINMSNNTDGTVVASMTASPSPKTLVDVAAEMERMDRILAQHALKSSVAGGPGTGAPKKLAHSKAYTPSSETLVGPSNSITSIDDEKKKVESESVVAADNVKQDDAGVTKENQLPEQPSDDPLAISLSSKVAHHNDGEDGSKTLETTTESNKSGPVVPRQPPPLAPLPPRSIPSPLLPSPRDSNTGSRIIGRSNSPLSSNIANAPLISSDDFEDSFLDDEDDDKFIDDEEEEVQELVASEFANIEKETKESEPGDGSTWMKKLHSKLLTPNREPAAFFPHTASPKLPRSYNEEYPGDITPQNHHHHHHSLHHNSHQQADGGKETIGAKVHDAIQQPHLAPFESIKKKEDRSTLSSIDAFEASFNTNFPDSFSPTESNSKSKSSNSSSIYYNPFSYSPAKPSPLKTWDGVGNNPALASNWHLTTSSASNTPGLPRGANTGSVRVTQPPSLSSSPSSNSCASLGVDSTPSGSPNSIRADPPGRDKTSPRPMYSQPVFQQSELTTDANTKKRGPVVTDAGSRALIVARAINAANTAAATAAATAALASAKITTSPTTSAGTPTGSPSSAIQPACPSPENSSALPARRSPIPSDSANVKLPLAASSHTSYHQASSPSSSFESPTQPSTPAQAIRGGQPTPDGDTDGYCTPPSRGSAIQKANPSLSASSSSGSSSSSLQQQSEPKRPEKTGYEAARARYERALQPRATGTLSMSSSGSNSSFSPSLSAGSKRMSPDKSTLWNAIDVLSDEEGDIPLHSSLSKKESPVNTARSPGSVSSRTITDNGDLPVMRTRQRPWEKTVPSSSSTPDSSTPGSINSSGSSESWGTNNIPTTRNSPQTPANFEQGYVPSVLPNGTNGSYGAKTSPLISDSSRAGVHKHR